VHYSLSDSGKIESAEDDSRFEPTDGAGDDDDDDDEGASAYSHDSDIDNNPLAEERRRGAHGIDEELRRSAQEGAANPLRTSNSEEHCTPPSPPSRSDTRTIVGSFNSAEECCSENCVVREKHTLPSDQICDQYQVI
jgi:hypothetical protein